MSGRIKTLPREGHPREDVLEAMEIPQVSRVGYEADDVIATCAARDPGPVDVVTGMASGDWVEILSGIDEGDEVVVSGQFLIDSESSLQASFLRMDETAAPADTSINAHSGH